MKNQLSSIELASLKQFDGMKPVKAMPDGKYIGSPVALPLYSNDLHILQYSYGLLVGYVQENDNRDNHFLMLYDGDLRKFYGFDTAIFWEKV